MYINAEIVRISPTTDKCTCSGGMGPIEQDPGVSDAR